MLEGVCACKMHQNLHYISVLEGKTCFWKLVGYEEWKKQESWKADEFFYLLIKKKKKKEGVDNQFFRFDCLHFSTKSLLPWKHFPRLQKYQFLGEKVWGESIKLKRQPQKQELREKLLLVSNEDSILSAFHSCFSFYIWPLMLVTMIFIS